MSLSQLMNEDFKFRYLNIPGPTDPSQLPVIYAIYTHCSATLWVKRPEEEWTEQRRKTIEDCTVQRRMTCRWVMDEGFAKNWTVKTIKEYGKGETPSGTGLIASQGYSVSVARVSSSRENEWLLISQPSRQDLGAHTREQKAQGYDY